MSTKITPYLKVLAPLGVAAVVILSGDPGYLFERLFVIAVYLFFFLSYLARLALLFFGIYAIYRALWKQVNGQRFSQMAT